MLWPSIFRESKATNLKFSAPNNFNIDKNSKILTTTKIVYIYSLQKDILEEIFQLVNKIFEI